MTYAIVIATVGRARTLDATVRALATSSPPPHEIILSCSSEADVLPATRALGCVRVVMGPRGLPGQRNRGVDASDPALDWISFFDDDTVSRPDAFAEMGAFLNGRPDVIAASGTVLADGAGAGGLDRSLALSLLTADEAEHPVPPRTFTAGLPLYGCNMHVRRQAFETVRFDDRLPGYAWLEDRDFSHRVAALGVVGRFSGSRVVHLGTPSGRQPGLRLGYAQVVNPLYFWRRTGSFTALEALALAGKLTVRNLYGALRTDPLVDRAGRLHGNLLGLRDALRGRLDPERMTRL